jgi:hypothetical protein
LGIHLASLTTICEGRGSETFRVVSYLYILGVFIARGKEDALVTLNMVPGETVYGEKKIVVEVSNAFVMRDILEINIM